MIFLDVYIDQSIIVFFQKNIRAFSNFAKVNALVKRVSGLNDFFINQIEASTFLEQLQENNSIVAETDRREYGDFQTNETLALNVARYTRSKEQHIEFILEPTCGRGNFILASIKTFKFVKKIVGVEIYQPYVWETKFKILSYYLENPELEKPDIDIIHANAFDFPYDQLAQTTTHLKTLIIGNPPWVTSAELSSIESDNLPIKSNFKKHSGFDAITGKGNFDIGEYISLKMLNCFQNHNGLFAFLIKQSVVKNLIQEQRRNLYRIGKSEKLNIDSKKEFNVSVNASLFITQLNYEPELTCSELDFYNKTSITTFGWYKNKFVYSIDDYDKSSAIDGTSFFIWRSGIKHDCSKVMELEQVNGHYTNALGETIHLEKNLVYGLLKSSDLKNEKTNTFRKLTIITQKKIGQDTKYIKDQHPLTFQYLTSHKEYFDKRKSSIYTDKPNFSIFGVGDYSFAPYKVAISGLYKSTHFTLVTPHNTKPIMLDDTCYFIGFNDLIFAQISHFLVNSEIVQQFLKSIIFSDSKRSVNKDILMRINFEQAYGYSNFKTAKKIITDLTIDNWTAYGAFIKEKTKDQLALF